MKPYPLFSPRSALRSLLTLTLGLGAVSASAATVIYTNNDALGVSSFSAGLGATNWDSGQPPVFGNDYLVAGTRTLRTPPTNGSPISVYTFAGSSLILGDGTNGSGTLSMKSSNLVTVGNLILTNGTIANGDPGVNPKITRLGGNITVLTNGFIRPTDTNRILNVTATLSGPGNLTFSDRGVVNLSGAHPAYTGPVTITGTTLDMDGTAVIAPSSLIVGRDSTTANSTNFNNATNIVRLGGSLNVGSATTDALRVGWRTSNQVTNIPLGVLDVSSQPSFTARVGNFTIGYSQVSGAGSAGAAGIVLLATNNSITATNVLLADTAEGTSPIRSQLVLGRGSNYLDTPIMVVGARKQTATVTLPAGGRLVLTNSATGLTDLSVAANNVGTTGNPTDLFDLSGGPLVASLGNLMIGQKTGGSSGGATGTLTLATNAANAITVNEVTLGAMSGNISGTTAARGVLNANGGTVTVANNLTLASWDGGAGTAEGALNVNGGTFTVAGSIFESGGTSTLTVNGGKLSIAGGIYKSFGTNNINLNGGTLDLPNGAGLAADTLVLNGTLTNAGPSTVSNLRGSGSSVNQAGPLTVNGLLDPATATTAGTLNVGSLTLSPSATLRVNLTNNTTVGAGANDLLNVTGDLLLGNAQLQIAQLANGLAVGTYRLANYTGEALDTLLLPSVGRYSLALQTDTDTSPKHLNLVVGGNPAGLRWGGAYGSTWDVNSTLNWTNLASHAEDVFFDNDSVRFDDYSINPFVTLDTTVQPGSITVSNDVNYYMIIGSGKITGATGLAKQGTGTLVLGTSNDFTGPVTISGGQVIANTGGVLGATNSGTTIASGGTFDVNNQSFSLEPFHVQGAGYDGNGAIINSDTTNPQGARAATRNIVLDGPTTFGGLGRWDVRGTGPVGSGSLTGTNFTLTKVGPNGVYLTDGIDINIGSLVINQGLVALESNSTLNTNADITVNDGATLSFYRLTYPMGRNLTLQNNSTIRSTDGSVISQNQVSGAVTLGGAVAFAEASGNSTNILHLAGPVTGPGQLVKVGAMTVELLHSANNWLGGTTISNGTLSVGNGLVNGSLPALPAVITNYGTLMFNLASNTTVTPLHEIAGTGALAKRGEGILALTVSNSFTGPVTTGNGAPNPAGTSGGILRLLSPYGFGDPSIAKTVSVIRAEVQLEGGLVLPPSLYFQMSAQSNSGGAGLGLVAFRNVSGTNVIPSTIELIGGAGSCEFSADAGLLSLDGLVFLGNISSRSAILSGLGSGVVNGIISNQDTNALTVEKRGPGTWTLTAANTYSGPTTVSAGRLLVNGSIKGTAVTVQNGGTLSGTGTVNPPVTVQLGGTLAPGASLGTLTLGSNLTVQGTVRMEIARNGGSLSSDLVTGIATNTYGGTLLVTNVGASALQPGDTFQLFSAAVYAGSFTNIVYPSGYTWTNNLAVNGTIGVASLAGAPTLGFTQSGNALSFTWTGSYKLQSQTNTLGVGLGNNWFDVPGGSTSPVTVPLDATQGAVFFRLSAP